MNRSSVPSALKLLPTEIIMQPVSRSAPGDLKNKVMEFDSSQKPIHPTPMFYTKPIFKAKIHDPY